MATKTIALVFMFPIITSIALGSFVMAEVLKEPERELNMLQFKFSKTDITKSDEIKITLLEKEYTTNTPIEIQVSVTDSSFDCGDLYITIYGPAKQVVTQSGFFEQCFEQNNSLLPVDDTFSEKIIEPGNYEIVAEMNNKDYTKVISASQKFSVK